MKKTSNILAIGFVVLAIVCISMFAQVLKDPSFEVVNRSQHVVNVSAYWRNRSKELGLIHPSSSYKFSVSDEAAMKFKARYPDGRDITSEEIYFTGGLGGVVAIITDQNIEVKYDHET